MLPRLFSFNLWVVWARELTLEAKFSGLAQRRGRANWPKERAWGILGPIARGRQPMVACLVEGGVHGLGPCTTPFFGSPPPPSPISS
jgi:hypothetical protein